jgi:hypothetical protein
VSVEKILILVFDIKKRCSFAYRRLHQTTITLQTTLGIKVTVGMKLLLYIICKTEIIATIWASRVIAGAMIVDDNMCFNYGLLVSIN